MVKCQDCKKEMRTATSCTYPFVKYADGVVMKRDTSYFDVNKRCHDCGIVNKKGNIHHFGCDIERCPRCKGQIISCNCPDREPVKSIPNVSRKINKSYTSIGEALFRGK